MLISSSITRNKNGHITTGQVSGRTGFVRRSLARNLPSTWGCQHDCSLASRLTWSAGHQVFHLGAGHLKMLGSHRSMSNPLNAQVVVMRRIGAICDPAMRLQSVLSIRVCATLGRPTPPDSAACPMPSARKGHTLNPCTLGWQLSTPVSSVC